jgi:hypothetical protein
MLDTCQKDECERLVYSQDLCKSHYNTMILQTRPESAAKRRTYIREYMRQRRGGDAGPEGLLRQRAKGLNCSVEDCDGEVRSRGLCVKHYSNWKRHGTPVINTPTPEDRFWAQVDRRSDDECWPWTGHVSKQTGYGSIKVDGRPRLVHRWAYEHFVGPIPPGYTIDHVWDNGCVLKHCANWLRHLEPVTMKENDRRARARKGAA